MRRVIGLLLDPVMLVPLLTLGPVLLSLSGLSEDQTLGLSQTVGIGPETVIYAGICSLAFVLLYTVTSRASSRITRRSTSWVRQGITADSQHRMFLVAAGAALLTSTVGIAIVIGTVGLQLGLDILRATSEGGPAVDLIYGPQSLRFNAATPGMVRVWTSWIIGGYMAWLGVIWANPPWAHGRKSFVVLGILFLGVIYLVVNSQSRTPAIAPAILTTFVLLRRLDNAKARSLTRTVSLVAILLLASLVGISVISLTSVSRGVVLNPLFEYADQCVANYSLALQTATNWTYGFDSLFGVVRYVERGLGADWGLPVSDAQWIWNPASCLVSLSYHDFGYVGFITYAAIGSLVGFVRRRFRRNRTSILWAAMYLWALAGLLNIWAVPVHGGADYWAGIMGSLLVVVVIQRASQSGWRKHVVVRPHVVFGRAGVACRDSRSVEGFSPR
jgi:hypothetical protein